MSPLPYDLLELFPDTIYISSRTSIDEFGKPTYANPVAVRCRVEERNLKVTGPDGQDALSKARTYLADPDLPIALHDRLTMPDGSTPRILEILTVPDENGAYERAIYT